MAARRRGGYISAVGTSFVGIGKRGFWMRDKITSDASDTCSCPDRADVPRLRVSQGEPV